jgi:hypothetical protein
MGNYPLDGCRARAPYSSGRAGGWSFNPAAPAQRPIAFGPVDYPSQEVARVGLINGFRVR